MKPIIVLATILLGVVANAQEFETTAADEVRGYDTHQCYSYTSIDGARGGWGYACTSYPSRIQVADFRSTAQALRSANDKIRDLTARVEALEKKLSATETAD
jgi:hypothetical protein